MSRGLLACAALLLLQPPPSGLLERLARHRNLGKAFYENPTTQLEAVAEFRQALELAPDSLPDRLNYGLALLRANRTVEGVAELEAVQRRNPSLPHTWFNLGIAYKQRGDHQSAAAQFRRFVELAPREPVSHYNLGFLLELKGETEDALSEYRTAARLDPDFAAPLYRIFTLHRTDGRDAEAADALQQFLERKRRRDQREGADAAPEDVNWSWFSEIYETREPASEDASPPAVLRFQDRRLPGSADPKTAGMAVLDLLGNGRPDLLAWSSRGIRAFEKGLRPYDAGLGGARDVLGVAPGDFDNDGLADLCVLTASGPALFRNVAGKFVRQDAKLPARRFHHALWLDYDHDYDVDLFLLGSRPALLRNRGPGGFEDRTVDFPFAAGEAIHGVVLRVSPDSRASDLLCSYRDRAGVFYRDRLAGVYQPEEVAALNAGAAALTPFDVDNDGRIDVAFRAGQSVKLLLNRNGRFDPLPVAARPPFLLADLGNVGAADLVAAGSVLRNRGRGSFAGETRLPVEAAAWTEADFNQDGLADLAAVAADGSLHRLENKTSAGNGWIGVRLAGVRNRKLADGAEVEVKAGSHYVKRIYQGVPLVLGTGQSRALDAVRVTWPNGLIQNETRPAGGRFLSLREAPRLSGSCPMIFTWNGRRFEFVTDVLGVAPLGASSGDDKYFALDHDEYVAIPAESLAPRDGSYEVRITEELSEVSYLDKVGLIALDHPAAVEVFTNDKWKSPPFPEFRLFGAARRVYPVSARNERGDDVLSAVRRRDRVYAGGFPRDMAGAAALHALELDFGAAAPDNRAVLVLNGWVDWADGSTFRAASQNPESTLSPPSLQMMDERGEWRTVIADMGMPSGKTKTIAVDLTGKFPGKSRRLRIATNLCVYWDDVFLGEDSSPPPARLTPVRLASARLRFRGFSRVRVHPRREQPEQFDYSEVSPASMWNPTPGLYTRYGDIGELLRAVDDRFVIMGSGDEARLCFDAAALPPLPAGWKRDFLLQVDGWAKDRDANTAFSQTVEPLPFHAMSGYPYPRGEAAPDDRSRGSWRDSYNTRPALRLLHPLRPE